MLVIDERTAMPKTEQRVLEWIRTWTGQYVIVGLAVSGCPLPEGDHDDGALEADLVVITPRAVVVLETVELVPEASAGTLTVEADGRWRLSGFDGDPLRDQDTNPFDRVTNNVASLKAVVELRHPEAFVDGLVVVVPPRESTVVLDVESRPQGCGVVLGSTPSELRAWFHRTAGRRFVWTAEDVHALLTELNVGDWVLLEDLVAEGFPKERKQLHDAVSDRRPREQQPPWIEPDPDVDPIPQPRRSGGGTGHAPLIEPEDVEPPEDEFAEEAEVSAPDASYATHSAVDRSARSDEAEMPSSPGPAVLVEDAPNPVSVDVPAPVPPGSASEPQFTDRWSSWVLPQTETPALPRATAAPLRSRIWATPEIEPKPLRRVSTPTPEARQSVRSFGRTISPARTFESVKGSLSLDGHRLQQLAACAVIAATLCAVWLLASTCSARTGNAVESPQPVTQSEVAPPPQVAEQTGAMPVPTLCLPFPPDC
ncbi:NERD domain-containing protein [Nocardia bhagyanarayanae]|uniref:Nuclease-like protein n=1 Tax=Nocardia bhagyanarayanae TaxID=1215925 RepID=A0A543EWE5_9NOCA|nr:NERD domain-containing protein [Nocardia bhagyanarayanae]TQM25884.1 nuclease-like protein [Nocardia bhagyanarayanae]